jgi:predicted metal-dependent hydrolase
LHKLILPGQTGVSLEQIEMTKPLTWTEFKRLVKKHHGWIENEVARFPTVYDKEQFEKESGLEPRKSGE